MKGKRTDLEVKAEIIARLVNWELGSDIARDLWVHESTISRIKDNDLQEVATSSEKIANLLDTNNELQSLADLAIKKKILAWEESIRISELVSLRESTFKQNQLIQGKSTDNSEIKIKWEV
jgi:hypothetical protein